jgi:hypothetical protein
MADRAPAVDMAVLEERVRAAARMVPQKETRWRRLEARTREQYNPRSGWMMPLVEGTRARFAVELVPCEADDPGAVPIQKSESHEQARLDARVLYDLWEEEQPADELGWAPDESWDVGAERAGPGSAGTRRKETAVAKKYGKKASEKVEKAMHERKRGTLRSGRSGKKVKSRKQAIAIGLSQAREAGGKVPRKKGSKKKAKKRSSTRKKTSRKKTSRKKTSRT